MKVRITGSTHNHTWYRDKMGSEYYVKETKPWPHNNKLELYMIDGDKHPDKRGAGIISADCEIVNEYKLDEGLFEI
jgi:hypothetical protein